MAGLGTIERNKQTGELRVLTSSGWQPMSPEQYQQAAGGGLTAFIGGAMGIPASEGMQMASPVASQAGELAPWALAGAGLAKAGIGAGVGAFERRGARRMAERVQERIRSMQPADAGLAGGEAGSELGGLSVGAAETDAVPHGRLYEYGQRMLNEMLSSGPMTADQQALVPVAERLGFEFLPGMKGRAGSPGRQVLAGSLSRPQSSYVFADTLEANQAIPERKFMEAVGLPAGTEFGTANVAAARQLNGQAFDYVRDTLPEQIKLPKEIVSELNDIRGIGGELRFHIDDAGTISRGDLFKLRSDLNKHAGDLIGKQGKSLTGDRTGDALVAIDDFIGEQVGPDVAALWRSTRERWLLLELAAHPGATTKTGELSWRVMDNVLKREMPAAYSRVLEGPRRNLLPATAEFMDTIKVANAFGDLVPNSGTATRSSLVGSGLSLRQKAEAAFLRQQLRRNRDRENAAVLAAREAQQP